MTPSVSPTPASPPPPRISVRTAVGEGRTLLSAYDAALLGAGVANFNLLVLSSVIPPGSPVERAPSPTQVPGAHGDRLYCVQSVAHADHPGEVAAAGIGWVVHPQIGGLFVEHHGGSEASVDEQIRFSLEDMSLARGIDFGEVHTAVATAHCTGRPVCALAIATYAVVGWGTA